MPLFDSTFSAFARGSLMSTAQGYVAIEDLLPGDNLHISSGEAAKILWIGSSTFVPAAPDRRMPLDQIMANTFGVSRPSSFLTIGPSARLLQTPHHLRGNQGGTQMFTHASEFFDGVNVIEIPPPRTDVPHLPDAPRCNHCWRHGDGNLSSWLNSHERCKLRNARYILINVPAYC